MARTKKAKHPVPVVPTEERDRLDVLIDTLAMMDLPDADEEGGDEDRDDKDEDEDEEDGDQDREDKEDGRSSDEPKGHLPETESYDKDFPSGGLVAFDSTRPPPRYSCTSSVQRWAYEVAGIDIDSLAENDAAVAAVRDSDNWSEVSGFSPQDLLAAREDRIEQVRVMFSDDLSDITMSEDDPTGMFMREARNFRSITVL
ncbi:uncharacterized protein EV422DRAFT_581198 [Fimicolochytrium jonesii]|uniref:uncharacterized protein n=1 Tax=Fimicolochytrium jonesii TaxID=1396493 RepID=UPI0022FEAAF9|nr:uncharacterized protein EV422DRAFT_581198 [Fimicolochytrium jonesii]KAI8816879.1 hypothetical protein EV422DRAFT_581198 [Fimicolochytrium jonesii]